MHAAVDRVSGSDVWIAEVRAEPSFETMWQSDRQKTESAAKSAVAAWIGKTIAQLGNALAAGETYPDDGA
jgi:hypothetical protein